MSNAIGWGLTLLVLVVLAAVAYVLFWHFSTTRLMRAVLHEPAGRAMLRRDVPAADERAIRVAAAALEQWGFVICGSYRQGNPLYADMDTPVYVTLFFNADSCAFAAVHRPLTASLLFGGVDDTPYALCFANLRADGKGIVTFNRSRHGQLGIYPELHVTDKYYDSLEGHWGLHKRRLAESAPKAWLTDSAEFLELMLTTAARRYHQAQKVGDLQANGPGYSLSRRCAWRIVQRALLHRAHLSRPYRLLPAQNDAVDRPLEPVSRAGLRSKP